MKLIKKISVCLLRKVKRSMRRIIAAAKSLKNRRESPGPVELEMDVPFYWDDVSDPEHPVRIPWPFE